MVVPIFGLPFESHVAYNKLPCTTVQAVICDADASKNCLVNDTSLNSLNSIAVIH
jgi:hypothetical protein